MASRSHFPKRPNRDAAAPDRRLVLKSGLAGLGAGGLAAAAPARAQRLAPPPPPRELRVVMAWPENFPGLGTSAERLAARVAALTDGGLMLKLYGAGELVPAFEAFDAVSTGAADAYHGTEYYWQGKSAAFNFFSGVPGGLTAPEMAAWVRFGGGQALWDALSEKFNIKPFLAGNSGVQMGGWFNKEIVRLNDLRGLKIRMPGLAGEVLRRLGAAAVSMPGPEIYSAMRSGAIDATDWVGPWNDLAFGLHRVAQFYYWPGFTEPSAAVSFGMNTRVYDSLTPAQKEAIATACAAENDAMYAEYNHMNAISLKTLRNKHKVALRAFPDSVMEAFGKAARDVVAEAGASDPEAQKIHDSYMEAISQGIDWSSVADEPYLRVRRALTSTG